MLYWMCEKSGLAPTWPQLEHAICRNFGGMESDELNPLEEFKQRIHIRGVPDLQSIPQEVQFTEYSTCVLHMSTCTCLFIYYLSDTIHYIMMM